MYRFLLIAACFLCSYKSAEARLKIPFGNREVLTKVADLPDTDAYKSDGGGYIDLGMLYEEYNIAWIMPLSVTKEPRLVGLTKDKSTYYEIPEEELQKILADNKLDKNKLLKLGFYTRYGGKIVAGLLVALIIWGLIPSKKKPVESVRV